MKLYVDFKKLDAEDMPSNISNKYNLQVRSINGGSDYKNIQILSLAEHDKQVRKEVVEEIKYALKNSKLELKIVGNDGYEYTENFLERLKQGE